MNAADTIQFVGIAVSLQSPDHANNRQGRRRYRASSIWIRNTKRQFQNVVLEQPALDEVHVAVISHLVQRLTRQTFKRTLIVLKAAKRKSQYYRATQEKGAFLGKLEFPIWTSSIEKWRFSRER